MTRSRTCELFAASAAIALAVGLAPVAAVAQPAADPVAAEALFKAARALLDAGDWAAACPKFEASLALNPSPSTQINIARCHEREGKIATAWGEYSRARVLNQETAGAERRRALDEVAQKGIAALEPRLPRLRVILHDAPPAGLTLSRDGTALPAATLGEALPADPGMHEITAAAPGYRTEKRTVQLAEGATTTLELTLSVAVPSAPTAAPSAPPPPSDPPAPTAERPAVPVWAWAAGGAGVALAAASVAFLVDDLAAIKALRTYCHEDARGVTCDPGYDYAHDNARKNRSVGLFAGLGAAGLAGITVAIVGFARTPRDAKPASTAIRVDPWAGPNGAGLTLSGRLW